MSASALTAAAVPTGMQMKNRLMLVVVPAMVLVCGGCVNEGTIQTSEYGLHVYEGGHPAKPRTGETDSVSVVGLRIVRNADRSLVLVFPSGRRENLGTAPPSSPPPDTLMFLFTSPFVLESIHQLPAVLSADVRRRQEPDSTDAFRAAWALLAADHIPIHGQSDRFRFVGWIRLTNTEWTMLFDAVHDSKIAPATSPAGSSG